MSKHEKIISTQADFESFCSELEQVPDIAFDTEFVSEHTYRPQLCLLQVATKDHLVAVDPFLVKDVSRFWEVIASGNHDVLVHAGREETLFCYDSIKDPPKRIFDIQLAAGLVGLDYPSGFTTLTSKVLNKKTAKGETRTDWRKRPLSEDQLQYAYDDVRHLIEIRDVLKKQLNDLGRLSWYEEEIQRVTSDIVDSRTRERWHNVSGMGTIRSKGYGIVRELWMWREAKAQERNIPAKRILRDDLIIVIARRKVTDPKDICSVRGMERKELRDAAGELAECVVRGLAAKNVRIPSNNRQDSSPQLTMLGHFLSAALNSLCRKQEMSPNLVASASHVREFITYQLADRSKQKKLNIPALSNGWRYELVGKFLGDIIAGKVTMRIEDPHSEFPLEFYTE